MSCLQGSQVSRSRRETYDFNSKFNPENVTISVFCLFPDLAIFEIFSLSSSLPL